MTTFILEPAQMEKLQNDCSMLIAQERNGCDVRTILKDMYCQAYFDKTEHIGYVMADKVMEYVHSYNREVGLAMEDEDKWYKETLQKILEDKNSSEERCNALYKLRVQLTASNLSALKGKSVGEAYLNSHLEKAFTKEEASCELEEKLTADLKKTIGSNRLFITALNELAGKHGVLSEDTDHMTVKYGEEGSGFKAILAMKAYLETAEDGYLKGIMPENASLKDVAYSVCAGADTLSVAAAVESGEMKEAASVRIIRAIGMVLGGALTLYIAGAAGYIITEAMGGGVLAFLTGVFFAWAITDTIAKVFVEVCGEAAVAVREAVCFGARCIRSAGKLLCSGFKKLLGWLGTFFKDHEEEMAFEAGETPYTEPVQEADPARERKKVKAPMVFA